MEIENNRLPTDPIDAAFIDTVHQLLLNAPERKLHGLFRLGRESMNCLPGTWTPGKELFPGTYISSYFTDSRMGLRILKLLYELKLDVPFDWMHWDTGRELLSGEDPNKLNGLSAPFLVALLTLLMRKDRFVEGSWDAAVQKGIVAKLLSELEARLDEQKNA